MAEGTGLQTLTRSSDVMLALGVVGIIAVMVVPVPTPVLDALLAFNITFSLVVLLVSMYTLEPLEFSVFPSLLLVMTLFRLSLNVASTRLILLHGNEGTGAAGRVIHSFGSFVVGGNYVVGIVVFLILVVINFIVITKGAGRIAEVAARVTLDAMPGKQMSIDADLNAGLINDAEARGRRQKISQEADFYGAMDGASKFVRGDAIAGILITLINIVGGFAIGVLQLGLPVGRAAQTYTVLTIGDGLVTQIPALLVSTAAGIVVTRAASQSNLGAQLTGQILVHPRAIGIAAGILLILGLVPGLPQLPFLSLAVITGIVAYVLHQATRVTAQREREAMAAPPPEPEKVESLLPLDLMEVDVGYGLIPLVDAQQGGELLDRIRSIRRQFALELGIIIPPLHIRDNLELKPGEYTVLIKGVEVARGELMMDHYLAMDTGGVEKPVEGIPTKEPAFGLPALWVTEANRERAQMLGYTVVDPATVIATHLSEIIKANAHELLGRSEVQALLDNLSRHHPKVVEELIPNLLSLGGVQKVLQNLVREGVSIRDLRTVLECLADYAPITKDPEVLTEYVRASLSRTITRQYQAPDGSLHLVTLEKGLEETIASALKKTEHGSYLALEPQMAELLVERVREVVDKFSISDHYPVLLSPPTLRSHLKRLLEKFIPNLAVLSPGEIAPNVKVISLGTVSL
ncbi:MAG: flagellar biosynthesis protein FlhA [Nitrospinota bacterium]